MLTKVVHALLYKSSTGLPVLVKKCKASRTSKWKSCIDSEIKYFFEFGKVETSRKFIRGYRKEGRYASCESGSK